MKAFIARYYKTEKKAIRHANKMKKLWRGKIAWYILCEENGYFVISESTARKLFPLTKFSYKERRFS